MGTTRTRATSLKFAVSTSKEVKGLAVQSLISMERITTPSAQVSVLSRRKKRVTLMTLRSVGASSKWAKPLVVAWYLSCHSGTTRPPTCFGLTAPGQGAQQALVLRVDHAIHRQESPAQLEPS